MVLPIQTFQVCAISRSATFPKMFVEAVTSQQLWLYDPSSPTRPLGQFASTNRKEGVGFEPTVPGGTPVFKTGAFVRSANLPYAHGEIRTLNPVRALVSKTSTYTYSAT